MAKAGLETFGAQNDRDLDEIAATFAGYEPRPVDRPRLLSWLNNLQRQHWQLGIKLLRQVKYYGIAEIMRLMTPLRDVIRGQLEADGYDEAHAVYVPYGRVGESANDVIRRFRNVNHLQNRADHFLSPTDLPDWCVRNTQPVVFLDDFVGTGKQVGDNWEELFSQLVLPTTPVYLAVLAAWGPGMDKIRERTPLHVLNIHTLGHRLQLESCPGLTASEKNTIARYCGDAGNEPLGFGDLGLLLSFAYSTPNNSISLLRGSKGQRTFPGILPGYPDLAP
jgi:hypothetical protein